MRLEKLRLRNIGTFRDFSVDLSALPGPLVAVTGPNGAGKSTLLELGLPGALYRQTPTRGSLVELARARDAMVEARVVNGQPWTIRHLLDKISGKSEAAVLDAVGAAVLPDTKVRSFDAWAARHLPAPEVLYACMFAPQGAGGFLAAKPAERKATLLRILGIERYEALAGAAGDRARAERARLETVRARLEDERARGGDVAAAEAELVRLDAAARDAAGELVAARAALEVVTIALQGRSEEERLARERDARRADLRVQISGAEKALADMDERIRNNRIVLAQAEKIRAAVANAERLKAAIQSATADASTAERAARHLEEQASAAERSRASWETRAQRARQTLAERDAVEQARDAIPSREAALRVAEKALADAESDLEAAQGKRAAGADDRIRALRGGHQRVIAAPEQAAETASESLSEDDRAVTEAAKLPGELDAAKRAVVAARLEKANAERALEQARSSAARALALADAERDLRDAEAELAKLDVAALRAESRRYAEQAAALRKTGSELSRDLEPVLMLAGKAGPLAGAEGRLAELEPAAEAKRAELGALNEQLAALPPLGAPPPLSDAEARSRVAAAERAAREAQTALVRATAALERAREASVRIADLEAERALIKAALADWTRLAQDLGRDGLQALEIDAAGPELTALVNDLLRTCHGSRFTIRIDTQRLSADGKRQLEGCDVVVLDTIGGREAEGSTFSGGERVILGEALSLALSMLACRRAGLERPTLVRDESGAALDPENARVYVAMLRRAAQIVGADKVLFVSHDPEIQQLADARIEIGGALCP
jgi:exonuclease SbcC